MLYFPFSVLSPTTTTGLLRPALGATPPLHVALNQSHALLLVLVTELGIEPPVIEPGWWQSIWPGQGCVQFSARPVLPYPDALEAALAMHAALANDPAPDSVFMSGETAAWVQAAASLFSAGVAQRG